MSDESVTREPAEIKAAYEASNGEWPDDMDVVLASDPELVDAFQRLAAVPARGHLEPLVREFVSLAANASTTLLYEPAVRAHLRNALALGATREQILEVFELTSVVGIHAITAGLPVVKEELAAAGDVLDDELTNRQRDVKDEYVARRGDWGPFYEDWVRLDADLMEAYIGYSTVPWVNGHLDPKVKEFIYIAIDAATTHLYEPGTRIHVRNAIKHGATRAEIAEVFAVVATIGIHACTMGIPVLLEEWERHEERSA